MAHRHTGRFDRLLLESSAGLTVAVCHPWVGAIGGGGYGQYNGRPAHLVMLERDGVEVPPGHEVDHTCHDPLVCLLGKRCPHRRCVNRAHLAVVTTRENTLRGASPAAQAARRTVCPSCLKPYDGVFHTKRSGDVRYCKGCRAAGIRKRRTSSGLVVVE